MTRYIAVDTETELIAARTQVLAGKKPVNCSPFQVPRLSCISAHASNEDLAGGPHLWHPRTGVYAIRDLLLDGAHLVFHNAPFDVQVLCKEEPALWPLFQAAYTEGRIHDTGVLYQLHKLEQGHYDRPDPARGWATPEVLRPHLADLARELCGMELDKGEDIRLTFGQYIGCFERMSERHRTYAKQDAVATYRVFEKLRAAGALELGEGLQVRADYCGAMYDHRGVAVDRAEAGRLLALFQKDMPELERAVVEHGLGEFVPKPNTRTRTVFPWTIAVDREQPKDWHLCGTLFQRVKHYKKHYTVETAQPEFHLRQALVRKQLTALIPSLPKPPKYTETGLLSIVADDWAEYIPADNAGLQAWLRHQKLAKIIGTYLKLYTRVDEVFPRWNLLVRTGRRSASNPAIQQIPKRKYGIRSLFVPRPGTVFVKADYCWQELVCLAEVMLKFNIRGPLSEAIQRGDPHSFVARLVLAPQHKEILEWCRSVSDYYRGVESVSGGVGSGPEHGTQKATATSKMGSLTDIVTDSPGKSGVDPYPAGCVSAITATTLAALTRTISLLGLIPTTGGTLPERAGLQEVEAVIGKETLLSLTQYVCEHGVPVSKNERQAAKALAFGIPGGLGPVKLQDYAAKTYGVVWTLDQARAMRQRFLAAFPDIDQYLKVMSSPLSAGLVKASGNGAEYWKKRLGAKTLKELRTKFLTSRSDGLKAIFFQAERQGVVRLASGRIRRGCRYTECANSWFQGTASDVSKCAEWKALQAGLRVVLPVHDELLVECRPEEQKEVASQLEHCMIEAFKEVCPTFGPTSRVEVETGLLRWGPATDREGKAIV